MITVATDQSLLEHLRTFEHDGGTVAGTLFEGGRLSYPERKELEHQLGQPEPYTLELEARTVSGLTKPMAAAVRLLCREAISRRWFPDLDPTLELLWMAHGSWTGGTSLDRLVCAMTMVEYAMNNRTFDRDIEDACQVLVAGLYALGMPPTSEMYEELFDGAYPACAGLGLVEVP